MGIQKINIKHVGDYSYCAEQPLIMDRINSRIGRFVSIGRGVSIGMSNHPLDFLSTSPFFYFNSLGFKDKDMPQHDEYRILPPVIIGNDVWIGDNVKIKNGIKIGDGAVIGTSAVVTKDVPPYAIVTGIPAKIIKYRFSEDIIKELLELKWWEMDYETIKKIPYDDINLAIEFIKKNK